MSRLRLRREGLTDDRGMPISSKGNRIGRDPGNDLTLPDPKVSRRHATLWTQGGRCYIRDEGSTNGTFVNDKRIEGTTELQLGDKLRLGSTVFILQQAPRAERSGAGAFPVVPIVAGVGASSLICVLLIVALVVSPVVPALPEATSTAAVKATVEAFVSTHGIAASFTNDPRFGAMAVHENGERLIAMTEADSSGDIAEVTGAVWLSPDGDAFVVYNGTDGLPERAVFQDYILLFSNYSTDSVDVAVIFPDGSIEITRDVPVDREWLSQLQARDSHIGVLASLSNVAYQSDGLTLLQTLKVASLSIAVFGCVTAIILSVGIALPCGAAVVGALIMLTPEYNALLSGTGYGLGAIGCGVGDAGSCIGLVLDIAADVISVADEILNTHPQTVERAESDLDRAAPIQPTPTPIPPTPTPRPPTPTPPTPTRIPPTATAFLPTATIPAPTPVLGTGDVRVTLVWNSSADLDLHITDPHGEEIYYGHSWSASGGELDYDDLCADQSDGGPENIFWPQGQAPHGEYEVSVNYYSECANEGSTGYEVTVLVDGRTWSTTGVISPNETQHVRTFTR